MTIKVISINHLPAMGSEIWYGRSAHHRKMVGCTDCKGNSLAHGEDKANLRRFKRPQFAKKARVVCEAVQSCRPGARCRSGACRKCLRASHQFNILSGEDVIRQLGGRWCAVSVVSRAIRFAPGELDAAVLFGGLRKRIDEALSKAGHVRAYGVFGLSFNEHPDSKVASHWRPSARIYVQTNDIDALRCALKAAFPVSKVTRRPVRIRLYDGRRVSFPSSTSWVVPMRQTVAARERDDGTFARRNTRDRPLRVAQQIELAVALHRIPLRDWTYRWRVRRVRK